MTALRNAVRQRLAAVADPARAPAMQAYMKSAMPYLGVPAVPLRQACKEAFTGASFADNETWQRGVLAIWRGVEFREERYAAIELCKHRSARGFQRLAALPMYREMIVTATSAANQCLYCVVAHGAILRIYEKKPLVADQVAVNYRKADITPRQRAMLDFAMKVCLRSHEIGDADFEALHAHGFDDEDAWDIAAITAFFGLSNRMASFSNMMPNPEFYPMGRVPREKK